MKVKRLLRATALALVGIVLIASTVLAIAPPDTTPTVNAINVYRSCLETNDQLYLIEYNIPYAVTPIPTGEVVSEAFFFRLMDGATQLKAITAYSYNDDGYNTGIAAIYFSAAEVGTLVMGWEDTFTVVISGNPTLTWTGTGIPYESSSSFTSWNDPMTDNLGIKVLQLAQSLSIDWGLTTEELYVSPAGTTSLSPYGEDYFGTSIPNLMTMQPDIFLSRMSMAAFYERDNPLTYATSIGVGVWAGTWIGGILDANAATFNVSTTLIAGAIWSVITMALLLVIAMRSEGLQFDVLLYIGAFMAILGSLVHFVPMQIPVMIGVILVLIFVYQRFFAPSGA